MKITNICNNDHLADCGLPDKLNSIKGDSYLSLSNIKSLSGFNNKIISATINLSNNTKAIHEQLDTKVSAFETANGESVLVYYNPNCELDLKESPDEWRFTQPKMCANFVYDLNGKKGPNTVGKDIGIITALYSTDPVVVSPNLQFREFSETLNFSDTSEKCRELNDNFKLPTIDELTSIFYNRPLIGLPARQHWSSSVYSSKRVWVQDTNYGRKAAYSPTNTYESRTILCIKR